MVLKKGRRIIAIINNILLVYYIIKLLLHLQMSITYFSQFFSEEKIHLISCYCLSFFIKSLQFLVKKFIQML